MDDRSFDQTAEAKPQAGARYIRFFREIGIEDVPLVGGKNASLGEMYPGAHAKGIAVPNGFAITAEAYRHALDAAGAWPALKETLAGLESRMSTISRAAPRGRARSSTPPPCPPISKRKFATALARLDGGIWPGA